MGQDHIFHIKHLFACNTKNPLGPCWQSPVGRNAYRGRSYVAEVIFCYPSVLRSCLHSYHSMELSYHNWLAWYVTFFFIKQIWVIYKQRAHRIWFVSTYPFGFLVSRGPPDLVSKLFIWGTVTQWLLDWIHSFTRFFLSSPGTCVSLSGFIFYWTLMFIALHLSLY